MGQNNHRAMVFKFLDKKQSGYTPSRPLCEVLWCQTGGNSAALTCSERSVWQTGVYRRAAKGQLRDEGCGEHGEEELQSSGDQKGGQRPGAQGWPTRPWGGLKGRQAGHTDCSTNGRITGIVTPTQPP